jgi:ketosteroid isomerase-like protein
MNLKSELLETTRKFRLALMDQQIQDLEELLAEDYRSFSIRGLEEGRELVLSVYKPGGAKLDVYDLDEVRVDVFGDTGFHTGNGTVRGTYGETVFSHTLRFTDVYIRRKGRWQLWLSHATEIRTD